MVKRECINKTAKQLFKDDLLEAGKLIFTVIASVLICLGIGALLSYIFKFDIGIGAYIGLGLFMAAEFVYIMASIYTTFLRFRAYNVCRAKELQDEIEQIQNKHI